MITALGSSHHLFRISSQLLLPLSFASDTGRLVNIGSKMVVFHQGTLPPGQGTLGKAWRPAWFRGEGPLAPSGSGPGMLPDTVPGAGWPRRRASAVLRVSRVLRGGDGGWQPPPGPGLRRFLQGPYFPLYLGLSA